jgi:hypothetical protein
MEGRELAGLAATPAFAEGPIRVEATTVEAPHWACRDWLYPIAATEKISSAALIEDFAGSHVQQITIIEHCGCRGYEVWF